MRILILVVLAGGCATSSPPGFVALYRWKVLPGCEREVRDAWRAESLRYRDRYGSCGARLHREDDGTFVSTAFWRDRAAWAAAPRPLDLPAAEAVLNRCLTDRVESLQLEVLEDTARASCP